MWVVFITITLSNNILSVLSSYFSLYHIQHFCSCHLARRTWEINQRDRVSLPRIFFKFYSDWTFDLTSPLLKMLLKYYSDISLPNRHNLKKTFKKYSEVPYDNSKLSYIKCIQTAWSCNQNGKKIKYLPMFLERDRYNTATL
jgi:hypothetical protein